MEQIWISIAETRLDFHPGAKLDFHHESNLDFIAEQYWIFNMKCVVFVPNCEANACSEALICRVHIVQKYFCTFCQRTSAIAIHA